MKKIFLIIFLILFFFFLIPQSGQAGLVPCGTERDPKTGEITNPCEFCHFFVLFKNIIDFLLMPRPKLNQGIPLVPLIAILMIVIGGVMFMLAHVEPIGNPAWIPQAQSLMRAVVFGLILIYGAWLIVNLFFQLIGVQQWTGLGNWWQIDCPVR